MFKFPWSHLFEEVGVEESDELHNELESKHRSVELMDELNQTNDKLSKLREISEQTFEELQKQNDLKLESEVKREDNELLELEYNVTVQMVMATKENLTGERWNKRVLKGVLLWLQQRKNLIKYLRNIETHEIFCIRLEKILFTTKQDLLEIIERLRIEPVV
jgi:hypothetical protein